MPTETARGGPTETAPGLLEERGTHKQSVEVTTAEGLLSLQHSTACGMGGGAKTGLPWERGYPPKFQSHPLQKRAPHWNIGRAVRCTQCGARGGCMHTNAHERKINEKWEELAEGKDNRPDFFGELPQGEGSPRRHGEWKLVFVPRDKSRDLRAEEIEAELSKKKRSKSSLSKNPIADKIARARREWEEDSVPVPAFERDSRAQSMTPSGGLRVPDTWEEIKETKFASVMQRDYFFSAKLRGDPRALPPSTPDLVHSLNQLNRSDGHTSLPTIVTADKSTFLPRTEKASAGLPRQRVRERQDFEARLGESVRHMESLNKNSRGHSENSLSKDVFRSVPGLHQLSTSARVGACAHVLSRKQTYTYLHVHTSPSHVNAISSCLHAHQDDRVQRMDI